MATQFFLRNAASSLGGAGQKLLAKVRGAAATSKVTTTVASGTNIQVTDGAGGQALTWFSPPLAAGVTISSTVTVNVRGQESAASVNSGAGILVQRTDGTGAVISTILNEVTVPGTITEFSNVSEGAKNGTYTPTSTTLVAGDRIKVTLKIRNVGTMGGGTATIFIDGPTGGASGDTFITFTENFNTVLTTTVNQITETDLAQSIVKQKFATVGQATETDLAQIITGVLVGGDIVAAVNQVLETDTAQTITKLKVQTIGQPTETDTTQTITRRKIKTIGQVVETDLAQTITKRKTKNTGQVIETNLAQTITRTHRKTLGQPVETDLAQTITKLANNIKTIGQVTETDIAQLITSISRKALGNTSETDIAQPITKRKVRTLGQNVETDLTQPIGKISLRVVGLVTETDQANNITSPGRIGIVTETDLALPITRRKIKTSGLTTELDTTLTVRRLHQRTLGIVIETNLTQTILRRKRRDLGLTLETDLAQIILNKLPDPRIPDITVTVHQTNPNVGIFGIASTQTPNSNDAVSVVGTNEITVTLNPS